VVTVKLRLCFGLLLLVLAIAVASADPYAASVIYLKWVKDSGNVIYEECNGQIIHIYTEYKDYSLHNKSLAFEKVTTVTLNASERKNLTFDLGDTLWIYYINIYTPNIGCYVYIYP